MLTATSLILALFFVDQEAAPLSGLTPMKVAVAMMLLGSAAFLLRVLDHLSYGRVRKDKDPMPSGTTDDAVIDASHHPRPET